MSIARRIAHIIFVIIMITMLAVMPIATHFVIFATGDDTDAVTEASVELPDKPSGDFIVLINSDKHGESMSGWEDFFTGRDMPVIFDDINCLVARGDVTAYQMAERFMLQLPENQMALSEEDSTLLASKAEAGYIDIAVCSQEMADVIGLDASKAENIRIIKVSGGSDTGES